MIRIVDDSHVFNLGATNVQHTRDDGITASTCLFFFIALPNPVSAHELVQPDVQTHTFISSHLIDKVSVVSSLATVNQPSRELSLGGLSPKSF